MRTYETQGYYGSKHTACTVLVYETYRGLRWYCVEGSANGNATYDEIGLGVDIETLQDVDCFTAGEPVETLDDLEQLIDSE